MGADFWALGAWWADQVAVKWEKTVEASVASVKEEAERQGVKPRRPPKASKTTQKRS
jgi:hypothetical protein